MNEITYVGIDPGLDGAFVVVNAYGGVNFFDTPTLNIGKAGSNKRTYDLQDMVSCLAKLKFGMPNLHAVIEKSQAMPPTLNGRTQGVSSSFATGFGYGCWLGILAALGIPYECIAPVTWKRAMLRDLPKGKDSSILKATQLFPEAAIHLRRKKDHGRAEALLIAAYGRRSHEPPQRNSVNPMQSTGVF